MKSIKVLISCLVFAATAFAENIERVPRNAFTTAKIDDAVVTVRNTGVYNHRLTWTGAGTRTTCSIKLEQSEDGASFSDLIAAQDCTTDGTATTTGYANYVRMRITALTGSGNTVYPRYDGTIIQPTLGSVTVDTTGLATSAIQTNGTQKAMIVDSSGTVQDTFGGGTQYATGDAKGTSTGTLGMVSDGTLIRAMSGTSGGLLKVDLSGTSANSTALAVSASSLPLPTGAATETTLAALDAKVTAVNTGAVVISSSALPSGAATSALQGGGLPAALGAGGGLKIDGSGTALPISAASLPLPSSAATSTKQSDGTQKTQVVDGSGNVIGATSNALDINLKSSGVAIGGGTQYEEGATAASPTGTVAMTHYGTVVNPLVSDSSGNLMVNIAAGAAAGGTSSNIGSAVPTPATYAGFNDGTNMQGAKVFDLDSAGGTDYVQGVSIRVPGSGGSTAVGVTAAPLIIAGSGTAGSAASAVVTVQGIASGTTIPVTPAANSTVDLNRIAGTATSTSNGTVDAGTQRVAIASNNTPFPVKTDQTTHGTTDKVAADLYQGGAVVATGNAVFVQPGTAASFTVAQGTATSLKTQAENYQGGSAVAAANGLYVQPGTSAVFGTNLAQVLGSTHSATNPIFVRNVSSAAVVPDDSAVDAAINSGENPVYVGGIYEATPTTVEDGDKAAMHFTATQSLKVDLSASAANTTAGLFSFKIDQTTPGTTNKVAADLTHIAGVAITASAGMPVTPYSGTYWPTNIAQYGGSTIGATNAIHMQPGTGAVFQIQSNSANVATQTTAAAILAKQPALGTAGSASSDVITVQGVSSMTPLLTTTTLAASQTIAVPSVTTGGATPYRLTGAATANLTSITDGATTLYMLTLTNLNAAVRYVKLFDKATAPDPSGCSANSDCPVLVFAVPGATTGAGIVVPIPNVGINFPTGLGLAIVTGVADTDETGVAANEIIVNLAYKH